MYEKVFAYLDAHAEDYAAQLCRWVEVPSVKGEATPCAPDAGYGHGGRKGVRL